MLYIMFPWRPLIGALMLMLAICSASLAGDISLGWDPEDGVAGFVVYYGTESGFYTDAIDLGTNTTATIDGLQAGQTYFFAIASYDSQYLESPLSAEISYLVPGLLVLSPGANPGDPMTLTFPEAPGHFYEVQTSWDLISWTTVLVTDPAVDNDWVLIDVFNPETAPQEFFRLIMH